jgi:hypothetical protein
MGRMNNSLIANGGRFASSSTSYIANVIDGGQLGLGPNLPNLDANTPPVFLPLQLVVTHVPTFFNYIDNGPAIFKSLFETHLVSFDGLDFNYSMEIDGTPTGRDGQLQNVPTKQVRSQISPTAMWPEKIGNLIFNFGRLWMNAMHDIDTQVASMAGIIPAGTTLPPHVASMYSADFMFIQYDSTYRPENIIDAFAMTNVFPTEIGSPGYQLNATETHRPDRNFTFTGIVQHNNNTVAVAKQLAGLLNLHQVNYQDALPIAQSIESNLSGMGIEYEAATYFSQFQNLDGAVG